MDERNTTLEAIIREYIAKIVAEYDQEMLERSFERFQFRFGKREWKRQDLYDRA
jgi:hypothetical protein